MLVLAASTKVTDDWFLEETSWSKAGFGLVLIVCIRPELNLRVFPEKCPVFPDIYMPSILNITYELNIL